MPTRWLRERPALGIARSYRRLPIRWRLAGGSAALTLIILLGFATIVGVLTTRRIESDFNAQVRETADDLAQRLEYVYDPERRKLTQVGAVSLKDYAAAQNAIAQVIDPNNDLIGASRRDPPFFPSAAFGPAIPEYQGYRVETRPVLVRLPSRAPYRSQPYGRFAVQYGRRLSEVRATSRRVWVLLGLGVAGGTVLALLAGLATARRAMAPIVELSEVARRVERTGDAAIAIPRQDARDEVAELAETLESMLVSLGAARAESEATLARQREFVADASHELRTPLTSVLANLELLEETLSDGDQRDAAASALRSSRRMRRLVADLLLLARADAGRVTRQEPLDLSLVVMEAAGELGPVAGDHALELQAPSGMRVLGARDELHRLVLNLMENALRHTDPGTAVEVSVARGEAGIELSVEDDGPGIAAEHAGRIFERFYRASSDRGGSSGLGLSIVSAVAVSHGGSVELTAPLDGRGARFVVRLPAL